MTCNDLVYICPGSKLSRAALTTQIKHVLDNRPRADGGPPSRPPTKTRQDNRSANDQPRLQR